MGSQKQDSEEDEDDSSDFRSLQKVLPKVVNYGSVELPTEAQRLLLRYGKSGSVKADARESVVNIRLQVFKRGIDTLGSLGTAHDQRKQKSSHRLNCLPDLIERRER